MAVQSRRGLLPLAHVKVRPPLEQGRCADGTIQMALFDSSVILLLIVWSGKKNGMTIDASKEIRDVHACLSILRSYERR